MQTTKRLNELMLMLMVYELDWQMEIMASERMCTQEKEKRFYHNAIRIVNRYKKKIQNEYVTADNFDAFESSLKRMLQREHKKLNQRIAAGDCLDDGYPLMTMSEVLDQSEEHLKMIDTVYRRVINFDFLKNTDNPISKVCDDNSMSWKNKKDCISKLSNIINYMIVNEKAALMQAKIHSQINARYVFDDVIMMLNRFIDDSSYNEISYIDFVNLIDEITEYIEGEKNSINEQVIKGELIIRNSRNKNILDVFKMAEESILFARNELMKLLNFELLK